MDPSNERRMRKRLGRANIWAGLDGNTRMYLDHARALLGSRLSKAGRQGSPLVDPPHISTPKTGPSTYVAGFKCVLSIEVIITR